MSLDSQMLSLAGCGSTVGCAVVCDVEQDLLHIGRFRIWVEVMVFELENYLCVGYFVEKSVGRRGWRTTV